MRTKRDTDWSMKMDYLLNKKTKNVKKMSETIKYKRLYSFSLKNFRSKASKVINKAKVYIKKIVKKVITYFKEEVKTVFVFIHEKLTLLENKILSGLTNIGKKADEYLAGRTETEEEIIE